MSSSNTTTNSSIDTKETTQSENATAPPPESTPTSTNPTTNDDDTGLTLASTIQPITDSDFANINLSLHSAILIFNALLQNEDTSQWYFLEKVHENYFPTKQKWNTYLSKISPNKPIDFHDIRKQIINGNYNSLTPKHLLNEIGSVFTNAMIIYDNDNDDNDDDMYDESQRLLTKFQTLCSEMNSEPERTKEETTSIDDELEEREDSKEDKDIIIPTVDDVFEIEDYYCASPWEKLISEIEKQLMAWNLHNGNMECAKEYRQQMKNDRVLSVNINVSNSDYNYRLEYHDYNPKNKERKLAMDEIINRQDDNSGISKHEICIYFGISTFILLLPSSSNIDYISESECMFMYSTLAIACFNIECNLSYFIPFGDEYDESYKGGLKYNRYNIEYICKSQRNIPTVCEYLDGIFKVFKRHLRLYYDETDPMLSMFNYSNIIESNNNNNKIYGKVIYQYIYDPSTNILALLNHNWRDFVADDKISYGIRWGPTYSPLKSLSLQCIWTYFPEGAFIDNIAHTDLNPYEAPKWVINAIWSELSSKKLQSESHTPLSYSLYNLLIITRDLVEDDDIVWRDIINVKSMAPIPPTPPNDNIEQKNNDNNNNNKLMSPNDSKHPLFEDFINENVLKNDLYEINEENMNKKNNNNETDSDGNKYFKKTKTLKSTSPPISLPKCVPFGSLLSIFVLKLFEIEDIDIGHIGNLWYKFTYEISNRWTDCDLLPGIYGLPDFRTCLLHQKLQLLNECIQRKLQQKEYMKWKRMNDNGDGDGDNAKPRGVEKKHPFLYLLNDSTIRINIPITQDHPIYTADKLEAHYEELVSLGSSMDASKKRAELQSKQLKSDMMAFKAANPKCSLEDFIRWYSPNDWIVDDEKDKEIIYFDSDNSDNSNDSNQNINNNNNDTNQENDGVVPRKSGHLSSRMKAKDNIWSRIWLESEIIPAMEQELLFDFDIEGNESLKWIMNLQPTDTLLQICQIGIGNCISILKRTPGITAELIPLIDMLKSLIKSTKKIWKLNKQINENYLDLENVIKVWLKELRLAEMGCACGAALTFKFNTKYCKNIIEKLMIIPYKAQIMNIKEKEGILRIIGQRIYHDNEHDEDDGITSSGSDSDSNDNQNEGKENMNGFWSWGSPKVDDKNMNMMNSGLRKDMNGRDSFVIYDKDRKITRYELPKPSSKQYTVLASAPRPHPDSQSTPNRMHVTIDAYGFKMALGTSTIE